MSTNHTHEKAQGCVHALNHCDHCDVAYCTKCGREWGGERYSKLPDTHQWPPSMTQPLYKGPFRGGEILCVADPAAHNHG